MKQQYLKASAWVLLTTVVVFVAVFPRLGGLVVLAALGLGFGIYILAEVCYGRGDRLFLSWLALFPLGYYYGSYPLGHPVVTFDRIACILLLLLVFFHQTRIYRSLNAPLIRAAWAYIAFLGTAVAVTHSQISLTSGGPLTLLIDEFILPLLLGLYIVCCFPVKKYLLLIQYLVTAMCLYCAAIGIAEQYLGQDLLEIPGSIYYTAHMTKTLARVNGPFLENFTLSLAGLFSFALLSFLRRMLASEGGRIPFVSYVGSTAAIVMVILPLYRATAIGLLMMILLDLYMRGRITSKLLIPCVILTALFGVISVQDFLPHMFAARIADPENMYARIAQQRQTWELFRLHPLVGVGFSNFTDAIRSIHRFSYHGVYSVRASHNTVASILVETGVIGAAFYLSSFALQVKAFWSLQKIGVAQGRTAWSAFLGVFIVYWFVAFSLTSGYSSPVNLYYVAVTSLIYRYVIVVAKEERSDQSSEIASESELLEQYV